MSKPTTTSGNTVSCVWRFIMRPSGSLACAVGVGSTIWQALVGVVLIKARYPETHVAGPPGPSGGTSGSRMD